MGQELTKPLGSEYFGFHEHVGRKNGEPMEGEFHAPPSLNPKIHPYYHGPMTEFMSKMSSMQTGRCADFDMRHEECLAAYGYAYDNKPCQLYKDDLYECRHKVKQLARLNAMREERKRQIKAGLRSEENRYDIKKSFPERYD